MPGLSKEKPFVGEAYVTANTHVSSSSLLPGVRVAGGLLGVYRWRLLSVRRQSVCSNMYWPKNKMIVPHGLQCNLFILTRFQ
jgi:hypothetical protein